MSKSELKRFLIQGKFRLATVEEFAATHQCTCEGGPIHPCLSPAECLNGMVKSGWTMYHPFIYREVLDKP